MNIRHAVLFAALLLPVLSLITWVLSSANIVQFMNWGNGTFTVWGWINLLSWRAWLFLAPLLLFAYFAYSLALRHKGRSLSLRLFTLLMIEVSAYGGFYYQTLWIYYQGGIYYAGGSIYHWWLAVAPPYLGIILWFIWPAFVTISSGFALLVKRT
ncbi:MAG: hypothetical protein ACHQ03_07940 [Candidatus Bathyarchaeia archaeon]